MPKIRFSDLPVVFGNADLRGLTRHLRAWVKSEPSAPDGDWYKDFGSFTLCGSNEYSKAVLTRGMKPYGKEGKEIQ